MRILSLLLLLAVISCSRDKNQAPDKVITVSIPPFAWFIDNISGNEYKVNIMVPPGADHHVYEPVPEQVLALGRSQAYISNGLLSFEMTWLDRFYETNSKMLKVNLSEGINLIESGHMHEGETHEGHSHEGHEEGSDPHYWLSPKNAELIAGKVFVLLKSLNPGNELKYKTGYDSVMFKIEQSRKLADSLLSGFSGSSFMIFHPALGYIARDYDLEQLSVETDGKEPSPSDLKQLIDLSREKNIKKIFVQLGYDVKSAGAIASETGAELVTIDPMGEDWYSSMNDIIKKIHGSLSASLIK